MKLIGNVTTVVETGNVILSGEYADLVAAAVERTQPPTLEEITEDRRNTIQQLGRVAEESCAVLTPESMLVATDAVHDYNANLQRLLDNVPWHQIIKHFQIGQLSRKLQQVGNVMERYTNRDVTDSEPA
ncbi:TPA: hypothetical protein EYO12_02475 [Candidatus Saccharibacteria bacterium]|nr:hypothetical protein [Candidatus Saccharibacteria bacterium]HIO87633.1 hypothetical protein [Candidatus Saccharibacteria bacterium]